MAISWHFLLTQDLAVFFVWFNLLHQAIGKGRVEGGKVPRSSYAAMIFGYFYCSFCLQDFGDSIPGHGGFTDRMDCQVNYECSLHLEHDQFKSYSYPIIMLSSYLLDLFEYDSQVCSDIVCSTHTSAMSLVVLSQGYYTYILSNPWLLYAHTGNYCSKFCNKHWYNLPYQYGTS